MHIGRLRFWVTVIVTLSAASTGDAQVATTPQVRLGVDSFAMRFTSLPEGRHVFRLMKSTTGFRYEEEFSLGNALSRKVSLSLDPRLAVQLVERTGIEFGQATSARVTYSDRRARGQATLTGRQGPRTITIDTLLPAAAFDGHALYPVLLSKPWSVGESRALVLYDVDEQRITTQTLRVVAREELTVPAGRFDALRAELSTTQLPVSIWVSAALPHRLLKVASANGETVLLP